MSGICRVIDEGLTSQMRGVFRRVVDRVEEKAVGWGGGAGRGAGMSRENGGKLRQSEAAAAHIDHGSDEISDHVMEEAVAADTVEKEIDSLGRPQLPS